MLPPVLVPRHSEFAPGHSLLPYQQVLSLSVLQLQQTAVQVPEPAMPHNVSFGPVGGPGFLPASPATPLSPPPLSPSFPGTPPPAYSPQVRESFSRFKGHINGL